MATAHRTYSAIIVFLLSSTVFLGLAYNGAQNDQKNTLAYILHLQQITGVGMLDSTHIHADFKIYIDGSHLNFNTQEYTEDPATIEEAFTTKHNKFVHTHHGANDTDVMHLHATGITLPDALHAFGIQADARCITIADAQHCNDGVKSIQYFVNDKQITDPGMYIINDLDRILISFGTEKDAKDQLLTVGEQACVQSKNCA